MTIDVVLSIVIAYLAVLGSRSFFQSNLLVALLVGAAIGETARKRRNLFDVTTLAAATSLIAFGVHGVALTSAGWWPLKMFGVWSVIWLPLLILAIAAEAIAIFAQIPKHFAATCVAGAAFMIVPTVGSDVTTPYHSSIPSLVIAAAIVIVSELRERIPAPAVIAARIVGPSMIVLLGWTIVYLNSNRWTSAGDLKWLLPVIALPATVAVIAAVAWTMIRRRPMPARIRH